MSVRYSEFIAWRAIQNKIVDAQARLLTPRATICYGASCGRILELLTTPVKIHLKNNSPYINPDDNSGVRTGPLLMSKCMCIRLGQHEQGRTLKK